MNEAKRSLKRMAIEGETTYLLMENIPGTDLVESVEAWLVLNADDETPVWRHKVTALRRAANLLTALADDIQAANADQ
jgi:hypothetical protein